jgi:hypothetical protein
LEEPSHRTFLESSLSTTIFVFLMNRFWRGIWLLSAISIFALTLPARGGMTQLRLTKSDCCDHMPAQTGHCHPEPAKSQDRQCCAACFAGLSLINVPPVAYIFDRSEGETLAGLNARETPRSARPPVPPPRA